MRRSSYIFMWIRLNSWKDKLRALFYRNVYRRFDKTSRKLDKLIGIKNLKLSIVEKNSIKIYSERETFYLTLTGNETATFDDGKKAEDKFCSTFTDRSIHSIDFRTLPIKRKYLRSENHYGNSIGHCQYLYINRKSLNGESIDRTCGISFSYFGKPPQLIIYSGV